MSIESWLHRNAKKKGIFIFFYSSSFTAREDWSESLDVLLGDTVTAIVVCTINRSLHSDMRCYFRTHSQSKDSRRMEGKAFHI